MLSHSAKKPKITLLSRKILFFTLLCSSTITLVLASFQLYFEYRKEINGLDRQFEMIKVSYLPSISENIWLYNTEGIRAQIEGIYALSDIVSIVIYDEFGTMTYRSGTKASQKVTARQFSLELERNRKLNKLGHIEITATLDNIFDSLWNRISLILVGQGVKTFLVSFAIILLIFHFISRRLAVISNYISQIGRSDDIDLWPQESLFSALQSKRSHLDELDELAKTIDTMNSKVRQLYTESEEQRHKLSSVFEGSHDAIIIFSFASKQVIDFNSKACHMLALTTGQLQNSTFYSLYSGATKNLDDFIDEVHRIGWGLQELTLKSSENQLITTETSASSIEIDGKPFLLATCRDIRERKRQEAQMDQLLHFDPLTNLPNRLLLRERIAQGIRNNQRNSGIQYCAMIINIDNFKMVNDALGQGSGDLLIKMTANILEHFTTESDTLAKLNADEFFLLAELDCPIESSQQMTAQLAEDIHAQFKQPLTIAGSQAKISVSIGCTLLTQSVSGVEEVLRFSDLALCKAKADGKDRTQFYHPDMDGEANQVLALNTALHQAYEQNEFELFYQPIIDLETQRTVSIECLLRWRRSDGSLVSPAAFIPALVESGLIIKVGAWVIEEACSRLAALKSAASETSIAINVSPCQLESDAIIEHVIDVLNKTGLEPHRLVLEITEDLVIQDQGWAIARLKKLRGLGVTVALDDFGTGYSSLAYLKMLPVNKLKIDQSFVRDMLGDPEDLAIVETIISIAKILKLDVIAEGVEELSQAQKLKQLGCRYVQGYYYQKPQPELLQSINLAVADMAPKPLKLLKK
ncbi:MAG: EAL domain-containing protein [Pseudomonadales bacterium]